MISRNVRRYTISLIAFLVGWGGAVSLSAQLSSTKISYTVMDLYALRYYPFQIKADTIVQKMLVQYGNPCKIEEQYQKTGVQLVTGIDFFSTQMQSPKRSNQFITNALIRPFLPWVQYAVFPDTHNGEIIFPVGFEEDGHCEAIYDFLGKKNIHFVIDELMSESDLFRPSIYHYFLSEKKMMDGQEVYEIAFYPKRIRHNAYSGYLYISADDNYHLVKTVYTRSNPYTSNMLGKILWTQTFENSKGKISPLKKETFLTLSNSIQGGLMVNRTTFYTDSIEPLSAAEQQTSLFVHAAKQTPAFQNLQTAIQVILADRWPVGGPKSVFEWASITQSASYNNMEGLRLRVGGNTTTQLNPHWLLGGYLAYGTIDKRLKYRGDLRYSLLPKERDIWEFPKRLFSLSYACDLNVPGQDLLNNWRDAIYNSFSRSADKLSLQKTLTIGYEHEWANHLSFHVGGRYLYDRPMGQIQHDAIATSEVYLAMRYAPGEIFMQNRDSRLYLRRARFEWNFRHRIGLKNVFGSDYSYHITDFNVNKPWYFPRNVGYGNARLSAGKVWNRLPFPLLFIPSGNQSLTFETDKYNAMGVYEFVTDGFVSGQVDLHFNWSPLHLLFRSRTQTTWGIKALYGSLSDNNHPTVHPELLKLPSQVHAWNRTPYVEMHIGLNRILTLFRVEWVQRLTYTERGMLLVGVSF